MSLNCKKLMGDRYLRFMHDMHDMHDYHPCAKALIQRRLKYFCTICTITY